MKRLREFVAVVRRERPGWTAWLQIMRGIAYVLPYWLMKKRADVREWQRRYRACLLCPLFDKELKRCRPFSGSTLGCGCYTPFSNIVKDECWGRESYGGIFGWGANDKKSRVKRFRKRSRRRRGRNKAKLGTSGLGKRSRKSRKSGRGGKRRKK